MPIPPPFRSLSAVLLLLLLLGGCTSPRFEARKTVEFTVPATDLHTLACTSHNGGVWVTAGDDERVRVRVELTVRGHTEDEAIANLWLLEVEPEQQDGTLRLSGALPGREAGNLCPTFEFTLQVPPRLALVLESHNGDLLAEGVHGPLKLLTHNGSATVTVAGARAAVESHNGTIVASIGGSGPLEASFTSHNGNVVVVVQGDRDAELTAATHNGSVTIDERFLPVRSSRDRAQARLGAGTGRLQATTHNGDVQIQGTMPRSSKTGG